MGSELLLEDRLLELSLDELLDVELSLDGLLSLEELLVLAELEELDCLDVALPPPPQATITSDRDADRRSLFTLRTDIIVALLRMAALALLNVAYSHDYYILPHSV